MDKKQTDIKRIIYIVLFVSLSINLTTGLFFIKNLFNYFKENRTTTGISFNRKGDKDVLRNLKYFDGFSFDIKGKCHKEKNFFRLPAKYRRIVRSEVWQLSKQSAGISIGFETNSPVISVKWELTDNPRPENICRTGTNGLDLYCLINGRWQFVNSAVSHGLTNESILISGMDSSSKEFLLNLPLNDGVERLQIGINGKSRISAPVRSTQDEIKKPIVFYGTSITQGGKASRPGMAYPSIISRKLKAETINLGFSNNGRFEAAIGQVMCEIDAELYVIDCTPNSDPATIRKNALQLLQQIRKCRPETPILLIESIIRESSYLITTDEFTPGGLKYIQAQNTELVQSYNDAVNLGINDLYYLESTDLIGSDHEGTVDGTHLSDLGHYRIADKIGAKILEILNQAKRKPETVK